MKKTLGTLLVVAIFLLVPVAHAQTQEALLQQISELLKIVTALQQQLATLEGNTTPNSGLNLTRSLYIGLKGADVTQLQTFLKTTGDFTYPEITGYYGGVTEAAVQRYQCREMQICSGTPISNGYGVVGPQTKRKLARSTGTTVTNNTTTPTYTPTPPTTTGGGGGGGSTSVVPSTPVPKSTEQLPVITVHPQGVTVTVGQSPVVSVTATGNDLRYQWQKLVGSTWTNILLAGDYRFGLPNAQISDSGEYRVRVSNLGGSIYSNTFTAAISSTPVTPTPAEQLPVINVHPNAITVQAGQSPVVSVIATGANLKYQWQKLVGSTWENISLAGDYRFGLPNAQTTDSGSYRVQVYNSVGSVFSNTFTAAIGRLPVISSHPKDHAVYSGQSPSFTHESTGDNLKYQWQKLVGSTWTDMPGAHGKNSGVPNAQVADATKYRVKVTNEFGSVYSNSLKLVVEGKTIVNGVVVIDSLDINGTFSWPGYNGPVLSDGVFVNSAYKWGGGAGNEAVATYGLGTPPSGVSGNALKMVWSKAMPTTRIGSAFYAPYVRQTIIENSSLKSAHLFSGEQVEFTFWAKVASGNIRLIPILWHSYDNQTAGIRGIKGKGFEIFYPSETPGVVKVSSGEPGPNAAVLVTDTWQKFTKVFTIPDTSNINTTLGSYTGAGFDFPNRYGPSLEIADITLRVVD